MFDIDKDPFSPPPSYTVSSGGFDTDNRNLSVELIAARDTHLRSTITIHIIPRLRQRARQGINHTALALIPSYTSADTTGDDTTSSVGSMTFGDTDFDEHIILNDCMDSVKFWTQAAVIQNFENILRDELNSVSEVRTLLTKSNDGGIDDKSDGSHGDTKDLTQTPTSSSFPSSPQTTATTTTTRPSWSAKFFSYRSTPKPKSRSISTSTTSLSSPPLSSSLSTTVPSNRTAKPEERFKLHVESDEICSRTVSPFGLYETMTRPAIIVKIDILH